MITGNSDVYRPVRYKPGYVTLENMTCPRLRPVHDREQARTHITRFILDR